MHSSATTEPGGVAGGGEPKGTGAEPEGTGGEPKGTGSEPEGTGEPEEVSGGPATPSGQEELPGYHESGGGPRRGKSWRRRGIYLVVGVVLAGALGVALFTSTGSKQSPTTPAPGNPSPTFSLPKLGGGGSVGVPTSGGGNGRPAILLFFASWCIPCSTEIPALASTYRHEQVTHSHLTSVKVIGIDAADEPSAGLSFVNRSGVTFPVGEDRNENVVSGQFYVPGLPDAVAIKANGVIDQIHYGSLTPAAFVAWQHRLAT